MRLSQANHRVDNIGQGLNKSTDKALPCQNASKNAANESGSKVKAIA